MSEEVPKQIVLIVDGPIAGEAEAPLKPYHRFETRDGSTYCLEGLVDADLWHVYLQSEMVTLDTLPKMLR